MFAKVHPAEDVKSGNTGSCHDLVRYLEKETGEGQRFFSHTEQDISPERVIMDIDGNKKALGANDAKFFMLSLNPSQSEQMHLIGRKVDDFKELTPQEKKEVFQKLEAFTRSAMDEYALNFGRDNIRGGQDLMYYARVETERSYHPEDEEVKQGIARIGEPKPGLNLHVHVIVSRKSLDGKVKLSPGAKSAGNTWELEGRGTVKRGFSHEGWKVRVQECFNRKFDYQAKEGETYVRPQVSAEIGKITNPELKRILQDEQFTAANQIVAAMREQGYTHQVRKGVHSFSREGEVFQVEHRLLKAFEQPLSDEQLKSITERFDLTKYEANPAGERDQVMSRVYNAKRGIFNKGIVRNKIVFSVNNLHIYDNLLLFTFEIENKSKLPYDIDYIRYYIIDKKTAKLTASQEVDQQALFSENYSPRIEGNGRMKYVIAFDKFTIPDEKVFRIEINEKNGGRHVLFDLENSDIVNVEDI